MLNPNQKAHKKWYEKNKEDQRQKQKLYRENNLDYHKKRNKEYYEKNKKREKEKARLYRLENKEKISILKKKAYNTSKGLKLNRLAGWRRQGIICDYDAIYDIYINTHKCDFCCKDFLNSKDRNLDHNHDTGEIRGILCKNCNVKDVFST